MGAYFKLAAAHRAAIAEQIEALIALLDADDAPFEDLEDDDPAGDVLEISGEASSDDGRPLLRTWPWYAADQRRGPVNYLSASKRHEARELGLVPNGRGGWRQPH